MSDPGRLVVEVRCPAADAELVADRLLVLGASAVAESSSDSDAVVLTADLAAGALEQLTGVPGEVRVVDPASDYLDAWREHARVVRAGRFSVRQPWVERGSSDPDSIELVVDPGHTFGSGTHESTRMCLELLGRWVRPGDTVLDVGCGSGILAVGALRMGAARATGVDLHTEAEMVSLDNAARNGVGDRYRFAGPTTPQGSFDVVVANMLVGELEPLGPVLAGALAPGGVLVLGGFLTTQQDRVLRAVGQDTATGSHVETLEEGPWRAVALREPDSSG